MDAENLSKQLDRFPPGIMRSRQVHTQRIDVDPIPSTFSSKINHLQPFLRR